MINPIMHPIGSDRLPSAVERLLSSSPNQVVATLLDELMKKTCPSAAITEPRDAISKASRTETSYLSHAPIKVRAAPITNYLI